MIIRSWTLIWFLSGLMLANFLWGCKSAERRWYDKGVKKGWVKDKTTTDTIIIPADTVLIDSTAEVFIYQLDTLLQDTCINKENKAKLKKLIKKEFIPAAQKVYKDTAVIGSDGNRYQIRFTPAGIQIIAETKKQEINCPPAEIPWTDRFKYMGYGAFMLIVLFFLWAIFRRPKK